MEMKLPVLKAFGKFFSENKREKNNNKKTKKHLNVPDVFVVYSLRCEQINMYFNSELK